MATQELLREASGAMPRDVISHTLKSISLFSDFSDGAMQLLLKRCSVKNVGEKSLLFLTGDPAEHFYVILDGWIKLFRETRDGHESVLSVLTVGDVFGKTAILKNGSFPHSAETLTETGLLMIPAAFLRKMAEEHEGMFDEFLAKFLENEMQEHSRLGLEAEHLTHMTSAQRVGCFLLRMCGGRREGSIRLRFPYEKSLVAGRLGMTPETFSRTLNQLSAIGVDTDHAAVTIHNIAQLRSHICGHCSATRRECELGDAVEA